ncbi:MAG: hypothetical protein FWF11_04680 [Coriobacteriia bacterium]|nr:hypothetical protein [Coriobacteriia bacterium]
MKSRFLLKVLCALMLALATSLLVAVPVFAEQPQQGTEAHPAQAALTKELRMPEGVASPDATFTFQFELIGPLSGSPRASISDVTLTFAAGETSTTADGISTIRKQSTNFLAGASFPASGLYSFRVTEVPSIPQALPTGGVMHFSPLEYVIYLQVREGESSLYVAAVWAVLVGDDGEYGPKIDITPGDTGNYSGMVFTNIFIRNIGGPDPIEDDPALAVGKEVYGDLADPLLLFDFDVTVFAPAIMAEMGGLAPLTVSAYIVDTLVTTPSAVGPIGFTFGQTQHIQLRHGQELRFPLLPLGTTYEVIEWSTEEYLPSAHVTTGGGTPVGFVGAVGDEFSIGVQAIAEGGKNSALFLNIHTDPVGAGFATGALFFWLTLSVILACLVMLVLLRLRHARGQLATVEGPEMDEQATLFERMWRKLGEI